jgi:hypothetical protein
MNPRNDMQAEMRNSLPDVHTLERLLGGRVEPDDAPPGYAEVARVLKAVATLPGHVDLNREDEDIAAARMLVAQRPPASGRSHGSSRRMRSNRHRVRVFGLVVLGTVLGTFGFAAAGVLPDTAQDALSNVLAHVGISVPRSDHPATSDNELSEMPITSNSTGVGKGGEISQIATTTTSTGVDKGAEISSVASDGKSQAGDHGFEGNGGRAAPVPAPNAGGTSTADTASDGHSHAGTDIADQKSGDRSAAGSGNRSSAGH